MCTFAGLILCGHIRMKMMGRWLWSWDQHSSFPFWGQDEHLQWWWWPYLVTSLISRVCRSRFLRGSKLSQMRFWLALTATPSQRQREHSVRKGPKGASQEGCASSSKYLLLLSFPSTEMFWVFLVPFLCNHISTHATSQGMWQKDLIG